MRVIVQRAKNAKVFIANEVVGAIEKGMVVLAGFENDDTTEDVAWLCHKLSNLRIFSDKEDKMNLNIQDVQGEFLIISQFTLYAKTKKGNRPSFINAAKPEIAVPLYEAFKKMLLKISGRKVASGQFGADMQVLLTNDGPVTIYIDTKNKE